MTDQCYDVVVIGAGHAGIEAALACARMRRETLLLTMNLDSVALMPCNPAIGGTAKGHLVREVDALGGEMGLAIDEVFIQSRMLNTAKGPAVHSLRAQADKRRYQARMRSVLFDQERLTLRQSEVVDILTEGGRVSGVLTATGARIGAKAVVLCTGVYLNSRIIIGEKSWSSGPQGLMGSMSLGAALNNLGFPLRRFKTGTPARMDGRTVDFSKMTPQYGDEPVVPFSFMTEAALQNRALCYLTYTTEETHRIILDNLDKAPMYSGGIHGTGARYCPSIEDKVVRFSDKPRHPIFMEPEGLSTVEWYVQGMSTSMPEEIQRHIYRSVPGLERAEILRLAYAIEYDVIDATQLNAALMAKALDGLFFAGQLNGTSGYEEAAAQGLLSGINAAKYVAEEEPLLLTRSDAYIGVMVDDLTVKGVDEPYRMMTSRAEYRLTLRQDNADLRLTEKGYRAGLASEDRYRKMQKKAENTARAVARLSRLPANADDAPGATLADRLRRPEVRYRDLKALDPEYDSTPPDAREQAEIEIKYEGYLKRQHAQLHRFTRMEDTRLPEDIDYESVESLRIEARQKLQRIKPRSLGQASRIPGVSPGDISVLMIFIERERRKKYAGFDLSARFADQERGHTDEG